MKKFSALLFLAGISSAVSASDDHLLNIGHYGLNGVYEPAYVNHPLNDKSAPVRISPDSFRLGYFDDGGVFEPGYLNHRYCKSWSAPKVGKAQSSSGYYYNGVLEPAYLNWRFGGDEAS